MLNAVTITLLAGVAAVLGSLLYRERKRLQTKDRFLAVLVEHAPDCIQVLNPDGTRRFINRAGLALLGAKRWEEIAARPAWEFIPRSLGFPPQPPSAA